MNTIFNRKKDINKIYGCEGPQAVPARPYNNGIFSKGKAFGSGESKETESGEILRVE
jgi:hypothetical protein